MTTNWRYADETQSVVAAAFEDGHSESHLITADVIQAWIKAGNTPLPYEPPVIDPKEQAKAELAATDPEIARVGEDLIKLLISKGIISESDLPSKAFERIKQRAEWRAALSK